MTPPSSTRPGQNFDDEAVSWLVRLRAPDGRREQAAFETWYMADERHADAYERVLASWGKSALAGEPGRQHRADSSPGIGARRYRPFVGVAAAAAIVVAGIGLATLGLGPEPVVAASYASVIGQIRTIALPDGSRVTLDTDTALHAAFSKRERRVRLDHGRARFSVHPDHRPFVVHAGTKALVAAGGDFDVDLDAGRVAVVVLSGDVRVDKVALTETKAPIDIGPSRSIAFTADGAAGPVEQVRDGEQRWPTGMSAFDNATLADVVERANRYATKKIVLADAETGNLRFTGTFRSADTPGLAKLLARMFRLSLAHDGSGNLVLRANAGVTSQ